MRVSVDDTENDDDGIVLHGGEPFTGTVVDGLTETDYVDGVPEGGERVLRPDGSLRSERHYEHGIIVDSRDWHSSGQLAHEARYELGHRVEEHTWDERGAEV